MSRKDSRRPAPTPEEAIARQQLRITARREFWALARRILVLALAVWAAFTYLFGLAPVHGEDMYPRLRDGDLAAWYRLEQTYNIGDVVTFRKEGSRQYGRVVARGGDTVDFSEDGQLLVNGSAQQEEVFSPTSKDGRRQVFPMKLGADEIFVLGDNRTYAHDSRDYGAVKLIDVDGKLISLLRRRGI